MTRFRANISTPGYDRPFRFSAFAVHVNTKELSSLMDIICKIRSLGAFAPAKKICNADLAARVDTNDQWIVSRTGIKERRELAEGENASDLGLKASEAALADAGVPAENLTHVITATCTPDYLSPSVSCIIAGALKTPPIMAFDISAACAGFIYGLSVCRSILAGEPGAKILFVCAEALTRRLDWTDRSTCVLFGDAASACVLEAGDEPGLCEIKDVVCQSDGSQKDLIIVGGGTACRYVKDGKVDSDFFLSMQGRDTYKHAVREMVSVCELILARNDLEIGDIDLFIPHQANLRIIEAVGSRLQIDPAKVFTNVADYGNTSAASIPLAIAEAYNQGRIVKNSHVLVTAFGAGLTWGAAILRF